MNWLRKNFLLLVVLLVIYSAFFVTHLPRSGKQSVLGTRSNLSLFQEPQDGKDPILSAINSSTKEIDMEMYLLSDKDVIAALINSCQRGVVVKVMLEEHPFGGRNLNQKTKQQLDSSCVHAQWTNSAYTLTHEKTIIIDTTMVLILNQNLTTSAFSKNREFNIVDTNPQDIQEIKNIFAADWERKNFSQTDENLVISPNSSREKLAILLTSAKKSIDGEMEVIDDQDAMQLLEKEAADVVVRLIVPDLSQVGSNKKSLIDLQQHGVTIKTIKSPYIHAKMILIDWSKGYLGSINFTTQSLDSNREVGIIISQADIIAELSQSFETDWENGTLLPETVSAH